MLQLDALHLHIHHIGEKMPTPRLIHPIKITISQWSNEEGIFDDEMREVVGQTTRLPDVIVFGQVAWETKDQVVVEKNGIQLSSNGYILFRYIDLSAKNITLKEEDNITKIGWQIVDLYIVALTPTGHYTDQNGATMVKAYFTDRMPSRGV